MKTTSHIIVTLIALLLPAVASANVYENRVKEALENITQKANISNIGLTYSTNPDPETGGKDGELRIVKFKLGRPDIYLINQAVAVYLEINEDTKEGDVPYLYTLWFNTSNEDRTYPGVRLYYSPENSILVGDDAENCYTVGFYLSENTNYRHTYTLEWSDTEGDSLKGRIITTFGPIKDKARSQNLRLNGYRLDTDNLDMWIGQLQAERMGEYEKELEKAQAKLEKAQAKLEKDLSKYPNHSSSSSSSSSSFSSDGSQVVKGIVTDPNGEPLCGAVIQPVGGSSGTSTDFNGRFMLIIPNHVTQLKVSYVGYQTQVLLVEPNMAITMKDDEPSKSKGNGDLSDLFLRVPKNDKSLTPSQPNSQDWMKKLLFYLDKIQCDGNDSRYIYLSKLYELCKSTECLDQQDLKIALQQVSTTYNKLKSKKVLTENELLFLQSMADVLQAKIQ